MKHSQSVSVLSINKGEHRRIRVWFAQTLRDSSIHDARWHFKVCTTSSSFELVESTQHHQLEQSQTHRKSETTYKLFTVSIMFGFEKSNRYYTTPFERPSSYHRRLAQERWMAEELQCRQEKLEAYYRLQIQRQAEEEVERKCIRQQAREEQEKRRRQQGNLRQLRDQRKQEQREAERQAEEERQRRQRRGRHYESDDDESADRPSFDEMSYKVIRGPDGSLYRVPKDAVVGPDGLLDRSGGNKVSCSLSKRQLLATTEKKNKKQQSTEPPKIRKVPFQSSHNESMEQLDDGNDDDETLAPLEVSSNSLQRVPPPLATKPPKSKKLKPKSSKKKKNKRKVTIIVEDASDTEDEFTSDPWRNRRPSPGQWIEHVELDVATNF